MWPWTVVSIRNPWTALDLRQEKWISRFIKSSCSVSLNIWSTLILHQYYNWEKYSNDFYFSMMNTASRDPFVHQADAAYDDHIKKQGQAPDYFGWFEIYFREQIKLIRVNKLFGARIRLVSILMAWRYHFSHCWWRLFNYGFWYSSRSARWNLYKRVQQK